MQAAVVPVLAPRDAGERLHSRRICRGPSRRFRRRAARPFRGCARVYRSRPVRLDHWRLHCTPPPPPPPHPPPPRPPPPPPPHAPPPPPSPPPHALPPPRHLPPPLPASPLLPP